MSHCDEYTELISAALDGALSPDERDRLEGHLAQCPECRALYSQLSGLHTALAELPHEEVPAGLTERIMEAVRAEQILPFTPPEKKKASLPTRKWLASAAVLAIVLLGTWSWRPWDRTGAPQQPTSAAGDTRFSLAPAEAGGVRAKATQDEASQSPANAEKPEMAALEAVPEADPEKVAIPPQSDDISVSRSAEEPTPEVPSAPEASSAPEALPAPANVAPASAPKLGRSMVIDSENALEESASEPQTAAVLPEEENETQGVTAFQAPPLFSAPLPSFAPVGDGGEVSAPLMVGASVSDASAESLELTSRQALDVLLEAYPMPENATLIDTEEVLGWETALSPLDGELDPDGAQVSTRLEYVGLSSNGKYHEFWLSSFLLDDPAQGLAHSSTLNFFAVPLDSGDILVQRSEEGSDTDAYQAEIEAYLRAVNE